MFLSIKKKHLVDRQGVLIYWIFKILLEDKSLSFPFFIDHGDTRFSVS